MNVEKYVESLNSILGVDNAYFMGDKDVDNIRECIQSVQQYYNLLQELEEFKEMLQFDKELILKGQKASVIQMLENYASDLDEIIKKYEKGGESNV